MVFEISPMRLVVYLLTFSSALASAESIGSTESFRLDSSSAQFRIMKLLGTAPIHDGPNCFNAAAYVHGFVDARTLVGGVEFDYYLKKFCQPAIGGIQAGDILAVVNPQKVMHAAVAIDREIILEKPTVSGREGKADPEWVALHPEEGNYRSVRMKDSRWFDGVSKYAVGTQLETHRCASNEKVREVLAPMRDLPALQLVERLRRNFETIATRKEPLRWSEHSMMRMDIVRLAQEIDKLDGSKESDLYTFVVAESTLQSLIYMDREAELTPEFKLAFEKLHASATELNDKITSKPALEANYEKSGKWPLEH